VALEPRSALTRGALAASTRELLNRGNRRNPDVLLVEHAGERLVVKDYAPRGALVRATVGRLVAAREARAYLQLAGHTAVPRFRGWIDPLAFAVEYRPGRRMSRKLAGRVPADFVTRLEAALAEMHRRGVAHLDLRHRSNVLVADDGSPVLIDFGSAVCFRSGSAGARWLLPLLARVDRRALAKWRARLEGPPAAGAQREAGSADAPGAGSGPPRGASRPT
jgi:predicted Ser/Thr protein kinase